MFGPRPDSLARELVSNHEIDFRRARAMHASGNPTIYYVLLRCRCCIMSVSYRPLRSHSLYSVMATVRQQLQVELFLL